tara:strand:- start:1643 stop:2242 length:600 start_codon:yes stop_codon:yes gene_type:complete
MKLNELAELVKKAGNQAEGEKSANVGKVKAFMADGMDMKAAIKKAYPDYTEEECKALEAKLKSQGMKSGMNYEKSANVGKVKKFMADGMDMKAAIKKAYPDYTEEECKALEAKLKSQGMKSGMSYEKKATDLFGQPIKESMDDKKQKAKASPDASDNPKGLPARPNNSDEKEAEADTADIKVPTQSNDAVTGTGDGPEL